MSQVSKKRGGGGEDTTEAKEDAPHAAQDGDRF